MSVIQHTKTLIVEQDDSLREILAIFLRNEGCSVDTASDGGDALDKLEKATFDVVVTGVMMPEVNGIELLALIKTRFPETAVILMSTDPRVKTTAMRGGTDGFLTKPFPLEELSRTIGETRPYSLANKY